MKRWGLTLLFIGIFSFILPFLGLQFQVMNIFGGRKEVSLLFIGAGVIRYLASLSKGRRPPEREIPPQPPLKQAEGEEVSCSACGGKNALGDLFCGACGVTLASVTPPSTPTCGHCGTPISPEERFCGECGRPVPEKPGPAKVSQPAQAPEIPPEPPLGKKWAKNPIRWAIAFFSVVVLALTSLYVWNNRIQWGLTSPGKEVEDAKTGPSSKPVLPSPPAAMPGSAPPLAAPDSRTVPTQEQTRKAKEVRGAKTGPRTVPTQEHYEKTARETYENGDCRKLREILDKGLTAYPRSGQLWRAEGIYNFECLKSNEKMLEAWKMAYKVEPSDMNAFYLGSAYQDIFKDCQSALFYYKKGEGFARKYPFIYYKMAVCYEQIMDRYNAMAYYDLFIKVAPNDVYASKAQSQLNRLEDSGKLRSE